MKPKFNPGDRVIVRFDGQEFESSINLSRDEILKGYTYQLTDGDESVWYPESSIRLAQPDKPAEKSWDRLTKVEILSNHLQVKIEDLQLFNTSEYNLIKRTLEAMTTYAAQEVTAERERWNAKVGIVLQPIIENKMLSEIATNIKTKLLEP